MSLFGDQISELSAALGVENEAARLVLGLVLCQVFALFYRAVLAGLPDAVRYSAIFLASIFVGYFVYGWYFLHHAFSGIGFWLMFRVLKWEVALPLNFLYQLGYLVVGYYFNNMVPGYAINWTTSQALITLKMIGFGFDLNDKKGSKLPSVVDVLGYTFFFGTYIVGPLDTYTRYEAFMEGTLFPKTHNPPLSMGIKRLCSGIAYILMSLITLSYFTTEFLLTEDFQKMNFVFRLLYVTCWGHCSLYKYLGVWCIAESSCMYMGYTYRGEDKWDGLRNVATTSFHMATQLQHIIDSWNINTNQWCVKYVYKRCRFLGSKSASQVMTLGFLALWHGLHFGYFLCFLQEFFYMFMERDATKNLLFQKLGAVLPSFLTTFVLWLYTKVFLSFALVGFELYHYSVIMRLYQSLYFICPIIASIVVALNLVFKAPKTDADKVH